MDQGKIPTLKAIAETIPGFPGSKGALLKAQDLEFPEGYCMDYVQMEILKRRFILAAKSDQACAMWDIMYSAFKLGYLKGGRAALRGKYKEPSSKKRMISRD